MHRRGPARFILALSVALTVQLGPLTTAAAGDEPPSTEPVDTATPETADDRPAPTVSEFYPEDANLSDCLGLVERPGCGSDARGGWRQTAVFAAIIAGFGVIVWRISVGIRRNRSAMADATPTGGTDDTR